MQWPLQCSLFEASVVLVFDKTEAFYREKLFVKEGNEKNYS